MKKSKFLQPLKLQLFAESGEIQEVAEPVQEIENTEVVENVEISEETQEVAAPVPTERNFEKDSAFAKLRREAEQAKREKELLAKTLQQFGFQGTPDEMTDQANAHYQQRPVEEVRQERIQQEQKQAEEARIKAELEYLRNQDAERRMQDDLKRIQSIDPTVKSLEELGMQYFELIATGKFDALEAFDAVQAKKQRETKIAPTEIGKVNAQSKTEKEYYSPSEVDKLTEKELSDPKIWERVRNSMTKWK